MSDNYGNDIIKKEIVDNLKVMSKEIDDEKANAYVNSYESTFGNDGLNYLKERTNEFTIAIEFGDDYGGVDYFLKILDRIKNKDAVYDEPELIEFQKKNIADFAKLRNAQYKEEKTDVEAQQETSDFVQSIKSQELNKEQINKKEFDIRQLETAQKTGYVQGVCESVLAFNTYENKKIMSEATMSFLSKKLLSEMNVTKDMAQKFANPETYKALEKCLFAPAQEQQFEQTQTQGRRI